jgi:phospholipid N-methyltransferase
MADSKKRFWKQFIKSRKEIGAVTPSSRYLTKVILDKIDFAKAKVIVELGPGTGVFTFEILKRMNRECKLILVELNNEMFDLLSRKINDSRVVLVHGSANDLEKILKNYHVGQPDVIISSLPLSVMPERIAENIIKISSAVLAQNGRYIQFMYSLAFKKKLSQYFSKLNQSFVFLNFPPAFIFECIKA